MNGKYLILIVIFFFLILFTYENSLFAQQTDEIVITAEIRSMLLQRGLFLQKGAGLPGTLEVGANIDSTRVPVINIFREVFGLSYDIDYNSGRVDFIACDNPGCYTDNNIAVGDDGDDVFRAYGMPTEDFFYAEEDTGVMLQYKGVAFIIGEDGSVTKIYIFPAFPAYYQGK